MKNHLDDNNRPTFPPKRNHVKRFLMVLFSIFFFLFVCGLGIGVGIISAYVKELPLVDKTTFQANIDSLAQTSYAYFHDTDEQGKPIQIGALRYDSNREEIKKLTEVNPFLIQAFLSIEDHSFHDHKGIVLRSILRASWQQLLNTEVSTGGSTITQQLVKNVILKNQDKVLERKAKEIVLALKMEQHYSKEEILRFYINSVYFGRGAHGRKMIGVYAAAKGLFQVEPKQLNLAQAAYIAGMVQRPNDFNPINSDSNLEQGLKRMELVLRQMLRHGEISEQQYQDALQFDIKQSLAQPTDYQYAYQDYPFIMFALEDEAALALMKADNLDIEQLKQEATYAETVEEYKQKAVTGGYRFYTTIHKDLYQAINEEATKGLSFHKKKVSNQDTQEQLGATLIDNQTGAVLAFVASSQDFSENQADHAFDVERQPGSAIKPLLVYAPALEENIISPSSKILDVPIPKSDGSGYYRNANGTYKGPVTVSQALTWSYNIPAIKTFNALGHSKGFDYLQQMELTPHPNDGESAAIGGMTQGFTVAQMTAAFTALSNEGVYQSPYMISKIEDANNQVIWQHENQGKPVFSPQTAYQITDMLQRVLHGTASYIGNRLPGGIPVAGKTGTTTSEKDLWFIGYTPQITLGVWGGYDYNFTMPDSQFAKQAWINIFRAAMKASPDLFLSERKFPVPSDLPPEICGFECSSVKDYVQKKEEEKKQKEKEPPPPPVEPMPPALPPEPEDPPEPEPSDPEEPEEPEEPEMPEDPGIPLDPPTLPFSEGYL